MVHSLLPLSSPREMDSASPGSGLLVEARESPVDGEG